MGQLRPPSKCACSHGCPPLYFSFSSAWVKFPAETHPALGLLMLRRRTVDPSFFLMVSSPITLTTVPPYTSPTCRVSRPGPMRTLFSSRASPLAFHLPLQSLGSCSTGEALGSSTAGFDPPFFFASFSAFFRAASSAFSFFLASASAFLASFSAFSLAFFSSFSFFFCSSTIFLRAFLSLEESLEKMLDSMYFSFCFLGSVASLKFAAVTQPFQKGAPILYRSTSSPLVLIASPKSTTTTSSPAATSPTSFESKSRLSLTGHLCRLLRPRLSSSLTDRSLPCATNTLGRSLRASAVASKSSAVNGGGVYLGDKGAGAGAGAGAGSTAGGVRTAGVRTPGGAAGSGAKATFVWARGAVWSMSVALAWMDVGAARPGVAGMPPPAAPVMFMEAIWSWSFIIVAASIGGGSPSRSPWKASMWCCSRVAASVWCCSSASALISDACGQPSSRKSRISCSTRRRWAGSMRPISSRSLSVRIAIVGPSTGSFKILGTHFPKPIVSKSTATSAGLR
mmetsp:Transcript_38906/g.86996  ORF Transcript_38906/g.86996 Transcript_38906/m.86996 type:complete len:509 (+) Transcript_38906:100-1626(+)